MRKLVSYPLDLILFVVIAAVALLLSAVPTKADEIESNGQMDRLVSMRYYDAWMSTLETQCGGTRSACTFFVRVGGDDFLINVSRSKTGTLIEQVDGVNNSGLEQPFGSSPDQVVLLDENDPLFGMYTLKMKPE